VELLELTGLPDAHVPGDQVEFLGGFDRAAVGRDDPGVAHVQGAEVLRA
jgi:hypothetical protein